MSRIEVGPHKQSDVWMTSVTSVTVRTGLTLIGGDVSVSQSNHSITLSNTIHTSGTTL